MNILWLTNIPLPEASLLMNEKPTPFGGWLINTSEVLSSKSDFELSIAFPLNGRNSVGIMRGEKRSYYSFPAINNRNRALINNNKYLEEIIDISKPDIVHIFGTEYAHSLAMVNICKKKNVKAVISIQGLVSVIAKHYMASLPFNVQKSVTFRDFVKQDNLKQQQRKFVQNGEYEVKAINKIDHVIGRTTWDMACTEQINPNVHYHYCNETLREAFYKHTWNINKCEKHSIFISQGSYPLKGLHFMLEAMPIILERFPETKLIIGGNNITKVNTLKDKLKICSYGKYIRKLIIEKDLQSKVFFTGVLNEEKMCEQYLKSNVFVCPSSIENSPNSLGEAMILGVPCVAADVGGVSDLIKHQEEGFVYQSDAPYMLAHYVNRIFTDENLAIKLSEESKKRAEKTHDKTEVINKIIRIYKRVVY
ncbi:glycosyltransferase family 4 protein [Sporosarcina sp. CAU 1771]